METFDVLSTPRMDSHHSVPFGLFDTQRVVSYSRRGRVTGLRPPQELKASEIDLVSASRRDARSHDFPSFSSRMTRGRPCDALADRERRMSQEQEKPIFTSVLFHSVGVSRPCQWLNAGMNREAFDHIKFMLEATASFSDPGCSHLASAETRPGRLPHRKG